MKKIRIAQIGIGHDHADGKMECARRLKDVFEVVGIAEPDRQLFEKHKSKPYYEGLQWMSVDELLSRSDIDAVMVETPELDLVTYGMKCIESGKHIHLDKPAGENIDEFTKMMSLAKAKNLTVQLAYMYRYNPGVMQALEMMRSGAFGEIYQVDAVMDTQHSKEKRAWLKNFRGGIMFFLGCHLVDLVINFMGIPEEIIPYNMSTGFDGLDCVDHGFAVFKYKNGISTVRSTSTEVNGYGRRQLVICGSKASVEIKPIETAVPEHWYDMYLSTSEQVGDNIYADIKTKLPTKPITERYDTMMLDFALMANGTKENPYTYEYELMLQKAILKACGFDIDYKSKVRL